VFRISEFLIRILIRIRISELGIQIRLRFLMLLFSSVAFKMPTKKNLFFYLLGTESSTKYSTIRLQRYSKKLQNCRNKDFLNFFACWRKDPDSCKFLRILWIRILHTRKGGHSVPISKVFLIACPFKSMEYLPTDLQMHIVQTIKEPFDNQCMYQHRILCGRRERASPEAQYATNDENETQSFF
jgi:hypothetical protein